MSTTRLLALLLLIASQAVAQSRTPNDSPLEAHNEYKIPEINKMAEVKAPEASGGTTTLAKPLPDAPTPAPHRVIDKKFIAVMGSLGAAESVRFTTRKLVLDNEFAAGAPWVTHVTPNSHLIFRYSEIYLAELVVAYEMKKPHDWLPGDKVIRKLWWVYPAAMGTIHLKNGIENIRTQGPAGCTSIQCAEEEGLMQ